jgi:hypothetical protein
MADSTQWPADAYRTEFDQVPEKSLRGLLAELVQNATASVNCLLPSHSSLHTLMRPLFDTRGRHGAAGCPEPESVGTAHSGARARVRVRLLVSVSTARTLPPNAGHGCGTRLRIRSTRDKLREAVIVDNSLALLRPDPAAPAVLVRDPVTVRALAALFAGVWSRAQPFHIHRSLSDWVWDGTTQQILQQLREGTKDETAAARLGMSLRTYRRRTSNLLRETGGTSRFQAGARSVELGLLRDAD